MSILLTIQPTDDIQTYLNILNDNGGGILNLNPTDIFYATADITLPSNCTLDGNNGIIDFQNKPCGIKIIGSIGSPIINPSITRLTVKNSTSVGIETNYTENPILNMFDYVLVDNCAVGISMDNASAPVFIGTFNNNGVNVQISNTSGIEFHFVDCSLSTTGDGAVFTNCSNSTIFDSGFDGNFSSGITFTDCADIAFVSCALTNNGVDGLKLISGNTRNVINASNYIDNGGYGINVEDATTVDTIICSDTFSGNIVGAVNDLGTTTLIRSNRGVADN